SLDWYFIKYWLFAWKCCLYAGRCALKDQTKKPESAECQSVKQLTGIFFFKFIIIFDGWKGHPQLSEACGELHRKMSSLRSSASHLGKTKLTNNLQMFDVKP
ncbi:MAG: hypothetical protein UHU06_10990, partial [Acinetobacter pseudolwoffii]|nr:hypothetical protein [Acinetobacter pseudolwoffii]